MSKFNFKETHIEDLYIIDPFIHRDDRGKLKKSFEKNIFAEHGINFEVAEEIETTSKKYTIRGLHFFLKESQAKLIRVSRGSIYDVAVDLRKNSKTFGEFFGIILSEENDKMLFIPSGFAHGCLSLEDKTTFYYLCSTKYSKEYDSGIIWDDHDLQIPWPVDIPKIILSDKDKNLMTFKQFKKNHEGL